MWLQSYEVKHIFLRNGRRISFATGNLELFLSAPFRKCTKTAVVEVLVTSWHLLRYLFDYTVFFSA